MPSAHHQRPISFANYLLSLLLGLTLLASDGHTQETENTAAQSDPQQSESLASSSVLSEAPPYESRAMRDRTLIANALQDESLWLDTEYGKILAMHRITEAKSTLGVLLLLHAAEDPQHWPPALENVRANLSRYGWETLALAMPQKIAPLIPARPSSSSSSQSDESSDEKNTNEPSSPDAAPAASASSSNSNSNSSSAPREQLIAAYIDAALNYLKEKNQFNVVVLTDNSSAYPSLQKLLPMINDNPKDPKTIDGPLQALIIINLQQQEPLNREELESIFGSKQLPVMDIFFTPDDAAQQTARNLHRAVAMRKKLDDYQQLQINNQPTITETDFQSFLLGRVRGFMQKKASGIELKKEDEKTPGTIN